MTRNMMDYAKKYAKGEFAFEKQQVEFRRRNILSQLSNYPHQSILEVGCGLDPLFEYIPFQNLDHYTVVEPSIDFYTNAKKSKKIMNSKLTIYNQFIEDSQLNRTFDFIIVSALLHEISTPEKIIHSLIPYMHDSSILYINVPNAQSFHRLIAYEMGLINDIYQKSNTQIALQQSHTFDLSSLNTLLKKSGLTIVNSGSYFIKPFSQGQMNMLLKSKIIDTSFLEGLDKMIKYMPEYGSEIYTVCKLA